MLSHNLSAVCGGLPNELLTQRLRCHGCSCVAYQRGTDERSSCVVCLLHSYARRRCDSAGGVRFRGRCMHLAVFSPRSSVVLPIVALIILYYFEAFFIRCVPAFITTFHILQYFLV
jgi:hypothetical protein